MKQTMVLATVIFGLTLVGALAAQDKKTDDKKLSAEQELKLQVQSLKEQLHQVEIGSARCDAQLADANAKLASSFLTQQAADLNKQHADLDEELIKTLGGDAKAGDTLDRTTTPPTLKRKPKPGGDR